MKRNTYGAMNTSYKSLILAISIFFALSASISAAPGDLDPTFGVGGKVIVSGYGSYDVAIQPDGKIVTVGGAAGGSEGIQITIARYNTNGSPDTTFGGTGRVLIDRYEVATDVAIQPDGKIVVAGRNPDGEVYGELVRLNSDGSVDTSFGTNGFVLQVFLPSVAATLPDGKLLMNLGGDLYRLNANGSFDMTFARCSPGGQGINPYSRTESVIQPDGRIVTAFISGGTTFGVFRCNADGTLDTSFGSGGIVRTPIGDGNDQAQSIAIQMDGKIVVTGQSRSNTNLDWQLTVLRYHPDGALDSGFGTGGIATTPTGISYRIPPQDKVVIQTNGKIVVATTILNGSKPTPALVRYNPNGSLDTTFNGTGKVITPITNGNDYAHSLAIQADGKFVVVGAGENGSDFYDLVVRYQGDSISPTSCPNPIDCAEFFVRQHYLDFLGREPEPAGLNGWLNILHNCGVTVPQPCDRIEVSSAFFRSPEFQGRGYFIYRFYPTIAKVPIYSDWVPDFARVSGFLSDQQLEAAKAAFVVDFMARPEFQSRYASTFSNPATYVDALLQTVGLPNHPSRQSWINSLAGNNTTATRAQVLRSLVESTEVYQKYYNEAFVVMQYFGYLRRTADAAYLQWIQTMNQNGGDYRIMINGFMNSSEYRQRFGP